MNENQQNHICRLFFLSILIFLCQSGSGFCDKKEIPIETKKLYFEVKHYSYKTGRKREIFYILNGKEVKGKIKYSLKNSVYDNYKVTASTLINTLDTNIYELILILNHSDFLQWPEQIKAPAKLGNSTKIDTITILHLRYRYKGKVFTKSVKIENVGMRIEKADTDGDYKLKFVMLYIEWIANYVYDAGSVF